MKYIIIFLFLMVLSCNNKITKNEIQGDNSDIFYYQKCIEFLKQEEGLELKPYRCSSKKWTIGYGHRLLKGEKRKFRKGITLKVADSILVADFNKAIENVRKTNVGNNNSEKIIYLYAVLCFQTGKKGFEEFDDFIEAVEFSKNNDNPDSKLGIYYSLKNSKLNNQAPNRVQRYINLLVENV